MTDSLNGPLNAATQWLERSLDDSANRRLVLADAFLAADAVAGLAGHIAAGLRVGERAIAAHVARELPFMASENLLMAAALRGGDRQELHERLRRHSLAAHEAVAAGGTNPLMESIAADPAFRLGREDVERRLDSSAYTGRSAEQVDEFLDEVIAPLLARFEPAEVEAPRV
jgi:adenylosuccinate lyase